MGNADSREQKCQPRDPERTHNVEDAGEGRTVCNNFQHVMQPATHAKKVFDLLKVCKSNTKSEINTADSESEEHVAFLGSVNADDSGAQWLIRLKNGRYADRIQN